MAVLFSIVIKALQHSAHIYQSANSTVLFSSVPIAQCKYAVLAQIAICRKIRAFCAIFFLYNLCLCYFLRFFHLCLRLDLFSPNKVHHKCILSKEVRMERHMDS